VCTSSPQKGKFTIDEAGSDLELLFGISAEMPSGPSEFCSKLRAMLKHGHKSGARILAFSGRIDGCLKFNGVGMAAGALRKSFEDAAKVKADARTRTRSRPVELMQLTLFLSAVQRNQRNRASLCQHSNTLISVRLTSLSK
jgi:hypothetical protein